MQTDSEGTPDPMRAGTTVARTSDQDVVVTRHVNRPAPAVFQAFATADLLRQWWVPRSLGMTLVSCAVDARVGGTYRLEFDVGGPEPLAFFGTYLDVQPNARLSWTNEEGGDSGPVTTVTFEDQGGTTLVIVHERYPSKEALDAAGTGAAEAMHETFAQLDALLAAMDERSAT